MTYRANPYFLVSGISSKGLSKLCHEPCMVRSTGRIRDVNHHSIRGFRYEIQGRCGLLTFFLHPIDLGREIDDVSSPKVQNCRDVEVRRAISFYSSIFIFFLFCLCCRSQMSLCLPHFFPIFLLFSMLHHCRSHNFFSSSFFLFLCTALMPDMLC